MSRPGLQRLFPRSLMGQIALAIAMVLLVLQAITFLTVQRERIRSAQTQSEIAVIGRFVTVGAALLARGPDAPAEVRRARGRIELSDRSNVAPDASDSDLADRLREAAGTNNLAVRDVRAAESEDIPPPPPDAPPLSPDVHERRLRSSLLLSVQLGDGRWLNGQMLVLRPRGIPLWRLATWTIITYAVLLAAILLVLRRLVRPLNDLTRAAQRFRAGGETPHVRPRGPADVRRAIEAFNAMSARVASLIVEKDRMLGAIGHDLRTPLASLRIRAESVEDDEERERMIATITEMAGLLDDTLALARSGRSSEPPRPLDVSALADAVVEEFIELGQAVSFAGGERAVASIRPNLVRGALRNLIDNAVKYAGAACVDVAVEDKRVAVQVTDRGPGIPEAQLARVQEAFVRLEESRSRETGGSGLGITLARAAAQLHGGELRLRNRDGGGLSATLLLPRG